MKSISNEGVYGRYAIVNALIIDKCDGCEKEKVEGIDVDNSGDEYTHSTVCFDCLTRLHIDLHKEQIEQGKREKIKL